MNGWRLRLFVGVERLLARLGLKLPGKIMYIGGSDTLPPPLSRDEEAELIARLDGGDEGVKSQLIERNLRLVVYIARRFENTGVGIEDLISIGTIGLIKAINTYQPAKNIKLATYASRCIENEILMHLRKTANLKSEVSFDEPLNTDWDGNELLLSDILGTESDLVMRPIEAQAAKLELVQDILLEVNIGGEASKSGISPEELSALAAQAVGSPHVRLRGLMAIPPVAAGPDGNRPFFAKMRQLYVDIRSQMDDNKTSFDCLSMGMSGDFEDAVREGATLVRVGTALFGPRPPMHKG